MLLALLVLAAFAGLLAGAAWLASRHQQRERLGELLSRELPSYSPNRRPLHLVIAGSKQQAEYHTRDLVERYGRRDVVYVHSDRQILGYYGDGTTTVHLLGRWWESPLFENADRDYVIWRLKMIDPNCQVR